MNLSRLAPTLTFLLLWLAGSAAFAQTIVYPRQPVKDPAAAEQAGIGSYILSRDHGAVDAEGHYNAVTAEVFDVAGKPLANCEFRWLDGSTIATCTMADGNRYQLTWAGLRTEFLDLEAGNEVVLRVEPHASAKALTPDPHVRRMASGQWVLSGATWEEFETRWGHIARFFPFLSGEISLTLGLVPSRDRVYHATADGQIVEYSLRQNPPANIDLCHGGESFCDSDDPCEINGVFAQDRTICCSGASAIADDCCRMRSSRSCCANSLCHFLCLGICECFLDGWLWACEPPCG